MKDYDKLIRYEARLKRKNNRDSFLQGGLLSYIKIGTFQGLIFGIFYWIAETIARIGAKDFGARYWISILKFTIEAIVIVIAAYSAYYGYCFIRKKLKNDV